MNILVVLIYILPVETNISKIIKDYGTDFCSLEERMKSDRDQLDASKKHLNKAWGEISTW